MKTIASLLDDIRRNSTSSTQKGRLFEKLMQVALLQHPEYEDQFSKVWLWREYPDRDGGDIGIDLVAQQDEGYGSGRCAIQCKFYDTDLIPNSEIDKFLASAHSYESRILIATSNYSAVSSRKLVSSNTTVITADDLSDWVIEEGIFGWDKLDQLKLKKDRFAPRYHQKEVLRKSRVWFASEDTRGRLLMPCGTGKSVTALWLTEQNLGVGKRVLYLVPSISLINQTMKVWASQKSLKCRYVGVCSDIKAGRTEDEDIDLTELSIPVTTNSDNIAEVLKKDHPDSLTVVFSTYHSLNKICQAQSLGAPEFNLVICDEAHRTTGVEKMNSSDNSFLLVHDEDKLKAARRLYMTATQRIYTEAAKLKASDKNLDVYSMDDDGRYGPVIYEMQFGEAVNNDLLTDYQVIVIAYGADQLREIQNEYATQGGENISTDDWISMIGLWDALASPNNEEGYIEDRPAGVAHDDHCRQGLVFTNSIRKSKLIAEHWSKMTESYMDKFSHKYGSFEPLTIDVEHVDGGMNAFERHKKLTWLKKRPEQSEARLISNARCLSEGVDVPSLDAVLFIDPKSSEIEIVQSVGRVMRKSEHKKIGHIVLPVIVPQDKIFQSHDYLTSSNFAVVWKVLRALRSLDERLNTMVNSVHLANKIPIKLIDKTVRGGTEETVGITGESEQLVLSPEFLEQVASVTVQNVGDRQYWPTWGTRVGQISKNIEERITDLVQRHESISIAYSKFSEELEKTLSTKIEAKYLSAMVSQHVVTMPVFDALFGDDGFSAQNPISKAIDDFIDEINTILGQEGSLLIETEELRRFYNRMSRQIAQIDNPQARLEILKSLYESFFQHSMPEVTNQLGVVYTPNEVVDFMIKFVNSICKDIFGREKGISERGVNILDPFTGTGTFIYRLLTITDENEKHLISVADLDRKFRSDMPELQASEILLLAYYIASLKIEEGYRERCPDVGEYVEYRGIVFTDTFKTTELQSSFSFNRLKSNNQRVRKQSQLPIQIIISNPPWSSGQDSAHENNPNIEYPELQERVKRTYIDSHKQITGRSPGGNSMGNLFVKAIRWASDRVTESKQDEFPYGSIVAFVHPNSLTDGTSLAGMRRSLLKEFTDIYVVNLRGNAYKSGEEFKKEGDKVFGSGSRNGAQITFLVRDPKKDISKQANLHYVEVPDSYTRQDKFDWLAEIKGVSSDKFKKVKPDEKCNWTNITDGTFTKLLPVCSSKKEPNAIVSKHASGIKTNLDSYVYSFNRDALVMQIQKLIAEYNRVLGLLKSGSSVEDVEEACKNSDTQIIKWTNTLIGTLKQQKKIEFDESHIREVLYRPFVKLWLYEDERILSSVTTISSMFPKKSQPESITVIGGSNNASPDSLLASDVISDLASIGPGRGGEKLAEAILITAPTTIAHPSLIASGIIPDLIAVGGSQAIRVLTKRI